MQKITGCTVGMPSRADIVTCPADFRYARLSRPVGPKKCKCLLDSDATSFY